MRKPVAFVAFLFAVWNSLDEQALRYRASLSEQQHLLHIKKIRDQLLFGALLLVLGYGIGDRPFFDEYLGPLVDKDAKLAPYRELLSFTYWSGAKLLGYGILPALYLCLRKEKLSDFGLSFQNTLPTDEKIRLPSVRIYLVLFAVILPWIVLVSFTQSFQQSYPFYGKSGRSWFDFLVWETEYLLTFVAVEFFFRGYLLFGLRRYLGSLSVFISMVPYALIHVLKPTPEAIGSIFAGLLLGTLALCTGSLWSGVLLHISVALSMDVLSSLQTGRLPKW